ncbi:hypothetical protein LUZ61_006398 [Rhynchospora tenuis]|uniref:Polyprotein n=1 Tax=Rhynchospora tenuis TaxID=198213 RepID=A0AAD5ZRN1_9POAL|nr:hypothetical protein LUZ61_006398 [Rhynchospora tenuis]
MAGDGDSTKDEAEQPINEVIGGSSSLFLPSARCGHAYAVHSTSQASAGVVQGAFQASAGASQQKQHISIPGLTNVQDQQLLAIIASKTDAGASQRGAGAFGKKLNGKKSRLDWILDSGASHHMTGNLTCLKNVCDATPTIVGLPNGEQTVAQHVGDVVLNEGLVLEKVLYDHNTRMLIGVGEQRNGVYYYHEVVSTKVFYVHGKKSYELWHRRMGHPSAQNRRVERKHRHILNVARALRFQSGLPLEFWGECVLTASHLINRTPTPLLENRTPYEMLFGKPPSYSSMRIFGCLCYIKSYTSDKFETRSRKCVFVGYPFGKKGWRVYDLETREFIVSRDVVFCEDNFPFVSSISEHGQSQTSVMQENWYSDDAFLVEFESAPKSARESAPASGQEVRESAPASSQDALMSGQEARGSAPASGQDAPVSGQDALAPSQIVSKRSRQPPAKLQDYICYTAQCNPSYAHPTSTVSSGNPYPIAHYVNCNNFSIAHRKFLAAVTAKKEPEHFGEAMKDDKWREAMRVEIDALERNGTWTIENLPYGKKAIGCKWVYRIKYHSDGTIERYKARVVVLGNRQVEGIDFKKTFAPVAKMVTIQTFLAVAVAHGWELHQMDVHNAFLHGDLHEEVYMRLPPGFSSQHPGKVCRLRKSLYGLRQAPRMWFSKLTAALQAYGFIQSYADYSLFTLEKKDNSLAILVYVDDLVIAGNNSKAIDQFKQYLSSTFYMKDLGALKYSLGIKIARSPSGLFLCQRKYTLDILAECGLLGAKSVAFPIEQNHNLSIADGAPMDDPERYRRLVGRLIYLTITRPDLCYSVHVLAQFMHAPLDIHYNAAIRVLRYLKGSPGQGIVLTADNDLLLSGYCDSDWASCPLTRRSLTGYFVMLGDSPISWKTKKQHTVSRSSAEAEYRSMATTSCELTWLKSLLKSLGVSHTRPMKLICDSQAALHIAANPVFHERTKHIEIDCHFVRDKIQGGHIVTSHVRTHE